MRKLTEEEMNKALEEHPLDPFVQDGVYSLVHMADILGVSLPTLQKYLRHGMPAVERGGMGHQWRIRLSEASAWLAFFRETKRQKHERDATVSSAIASAKAFAARKQA